MEQAPQQEKEFDVEKSPIKEAYLLLNARAPLELSNLYSEEDQKLMFSHAWDYNNVNLVTNKVKNILESHIGSLTGEEKEWAEEILWFWYHHAISCAVARYHDKKEAQKCATKALEYQSADHSNKITRLLYLLVNDQLSQAEAWAQEITDEDEKPTAEDLIESYKKSGFDFLK